jgi:acyl-CoA dehydrogenase
LHQKAYEAGVYAAMWPAEYGGTPPKDCDAFHDLILIDELSRTGSGGILWACFFTFGIALPPILNVGSQYVKDLCARDVITGKKIMALAVTEPQAGSDVANLLTTAVRDGDHYIVNGLKKFISGGMKASWFTVAVRTGGPGMGGVSLLLVDANSEGVKRTRMKMQGWWISTTTLIAFDNVRVPVKNLIGQEGQGFKPIMSNFNHERFVFAAMSNRYARVCLEEAIRYGRNRKTFGKRLMDHQVIRHKVAEMTRHIEGTHAMLEQIAYQMKVGVPDQELAGMIGLTKVAATKVRDYWTLALHAPGALYLTMLTSPLLSPLSLQTMDLAARESTQIMGGAACVRGGPGATVERLYREVRVNAIAGGSEEILMDLAMRQAKL